MKANRLLLPILAAGTFVITACSTQDDGCSPIRDYAIAEFYEPDSIWIKQSKSSATLSFHITERYTKYYQQERYFELSKRYGDHIDKRLDCMPCSYVVGIIRAQMMQATSDDRAELLDVSEHYQLWYRNNKDYVTKSPRMSQLYYEPDSVNLSACKGDSCMWFFSGRGVGLRYVGDAKAPRPDSTTTLVISLSNGKQLRTPWLPKSN